MLNEAARVRTRGKPNSIPAVMVPSEPEALHPAVWTVLPTLVKGNTASAAHSTTLT